MTRPVMDGEFQVSCDACGQGLVWEGKGKKAVQRCGCEPAAVVEKVQPVRRITHASARRKGRAGESECVKEWQAWGFDAGKTAGSGSVGSLSNDAAWDTDVVARRGDLRLKIESKRLHKVPGLRSLLNLRANSEILRVREDDGEAFYLMSAKTLASLAGAK